MRPVEGSTEATVSDKGSGLDFLLSAARGRSELLRPVKPLKPVKQNSRRSIKFWITFLALRTLGIAAHLNTQSVSAEWNVRSDCPGMGGSLPLTSRKANVRKKGLAYIC